jgi:hypothetical protein
MKIKKIALLILVPAVLAATIAVSASAMAARSESPVVDRFGTVLTGLVERGIINQDQADTVLEEATLILEELSQRRPGQRPNIKPQNVISIVATVLEVEPEAVLAQLKEGLTLVEVIEAGGSSTDEVAAFYVAAVTAQLEQALADGQITQEQIDRSLSKASERVDQLIANFKPRSRDREARELKAQGVVGAIIEVLGSDADAIIAQVREGATFAEIIKAGGSSVAVVVDFAMQQMAVRLGEAVTQGKIDQEQADTMLSQNAERIENVIANSSEVDGRPSARNARARPVDPGSNGADRRGRGRGNQPAPNGNNLMTEEQAARFTEDARGNFNADRAAHFLQKTRENVG